VNGKKFDKGEIKSKNVILNRGKKTTT
jgi:hypothetical protein